MNGMDDTICSSFFSQGNPGLWPWVTILLISLPPWPEDGSPCEWTRPS